MRQNDLLQPRQIVVWGAIESSLDWEVLAPKLLTKLLRNVFVVLVSQWMDTRQREECLSCHWWKNKLVIGGKFEGKDWHDRRSTKYFEILIKISKYLALNFQVTIQNVMLFFIIRPVNIINLCPLLKCKIKQARDASAPRRNEAADERQHKHKKSHDKRLLNVDR
jgi:hypothetical protein